jgi:abequosyltransferase
MRKIAVAIPTFNRLDRLKNAIKSIELQEFDRTTIDLLCCLSNSASYDGTTEYIASLKSDRIDFVMHNQVVFPKETASQDRGHTNWKNLTDIVPDDVDWVWFMGDDDYLTRKSAISALSEIIDRHDDEHLQIIHVSQARRSRATGTVIRGNLLDLCNRFGFHEMLGWISSLVIKTSVFKNFVKIMLHHYHESAYGQSSAILELCVNNDALFIDMPWVDTQDERQTEESIKRWQDDSMGERYLYVVDGVVSQFERKIITKPLKPVFYRYHTYSLWDRYVSFLVSRAINAEVISDTDHSHWNRVRKIADTLDDPLFVKLYLAWHGSIYRYATDIVNRNRALIEAKKQLIAYHQSINLGCYPSQELLL